MVRVETPRRGWQEFDDGGRTYLRTRLPDPHPPSPPFVVAREVGGRYRVRDVLASGELTVLLRADDLRLNRPVVLKALRNDLDAADTPEAQEALTAAVRRARHVVQTERRLLVRLRNAGCNAVPVPVDYLYDRNPSLPAAHPGLDPFLAATEPYLVLMLLPGKTLEDALADDFPDGLAERRALRMILPVVRVLAELHAPWRLATGRTWHCVYQDLKPANLMLDEPGRLTLLDFGGCQVVVDGVPVLEGSCTPGYAPPEGAGAGPARVLLPCADVYTIGATLHQMLTGIDPREFGPGGPDLKALPSGVSPGLKALLARCLAPKPSQRPADARPVADAIAGLLA